MSSGKKLGLFWGSSAFSIIESNQDAPVKTLRVPFHSSDVVDVQPQNATDDIRLVSILKNALKQNQVTLTDVHLALPSKDIVIRSFMVPFLKPHEIKGVVEFEIKKYIPFNLKELAYSFHASPLVDDKTKKLRIHFVAIRKDILDHYSSILRQAGLNVVFSEPAPMCLVRALITKKFIKAEQKVAIVQTDFYDSRIIVFDNGVVQFVRDFQLHSPARNMPEPDPELLKKKLFNEIKISLDFYMRQFKSEKISEILAITFDPTQDIVEQLKKELELPVTKVDPNVIINSPNTQDIGVINAYGVIVAPNSKAALFNLSGPAIVAKPPTIADRLNIPEEYFPAIKVAMICAVILCGMIFLMKFNVAAIKKEHDRIVDEEGAFLDMSLEDIQGKVTDLNTKLEINKKIFRKTKMADILVRLPKILPDGVWLTDLNIRYTEVVEQTPTPNAPSPAATPTTLSGEITMDVGGLVYHEDSNQQFRLVYSVVDAFKADTFFKKYVSTFNPSSIQSQQRAELTVTAFKISGK